MHPEKNYSGHTDSDEPGRTGENFPGRRTGTPPGPGSPRPGKTGVTTDISPGKGPPRDDVNRGHFGLRLSRFPVLPARFRKKAAPCFSDRVISARNQPGCRKSGPGIIHIVATIQGTISLKDLHGTNHAGQDPGGGQRSPFQPPIALFSGRCGKVLQKSGHPILRNRGFLLLMVIQMALSNRKYPRTATLQQEGPPGCIKPGIFLKPGSAFPGSRDRVFAPPLSLIIPRDEPDRQ